MDNRDRCWVESGLERWGDWVEKHAHHEGYPGADALTNYIFGGGGGGINEDGSRSRILCDEMPQAIRFWHAIVNMLPDSLQIAVIAHYVPACKDDDRGRPTTQMWTIEEKAARLGITIEALRMRLSRAREQIVVWSRKG